MKTTSSTELLDHLEARHAENLRLLNLLRELPDDRLRQQPAAGGWNALQAIEHLNIWTAGYLDRIDEQLRSHGTRAKPTFRSTRIGNFFVKMSKPGPETMKIRTLKAYDTKGRSLDGTVLETFLRNHARLGDLLQRARLADLTEIRITTFLTSLIKMRLGDTLRMLVYHDWRHLEQACRAAGVSLRVGDFEASDAGSPGASAA